MSSDQSSQRDRCLCDGQACYKAGFWLGCSKSVVYTGGHNSYRSARLIASCNTSQSNSHSLSYNGWRSVDSYLKSRNFQTRINNQNLLLWIGEAEEMRETPNWKILILSCGFFSAVIFYCTLQVYASSLIQSSSPGNNIRYRNADTRFSANV